MLSLIIVLSEALNCTVDEHFWFTVLNCYYPTHVLQNPTNYDECIPIGDFSFDPHKLMCCTLESGNILSHGSGGKGYGLATTAITSGCFIWKVKIGIYCT